MNVEISRRIELLTQTFSAIEAEIKEDPVGRGIEQLHLTSTELVDAAENLINAQQIFIVTGFFIPTADTIETDGLSGAIFLARALRKLGKEVYLLADPHSQKILQEGIQTTDLPPVLLLPDFTKPPESWLTSQEEACLVAVERPGSGPDGKYRTMRGIEIPAYPLDIIFRRYFGVLGTISCADGLNEIGMGKLPRGIIPKDEQIQSSVQVDQLVVGGTADWAAFGIISALSLIDGKDLLPTSNEQYQLLTRIVAAGAVDGITGRSELSVDTLSLTNHQEKVQKLRAIVCSRIIAS